MDSVKKRIQGIFESFLTEMPHETIDYEIERFTSPSIDLQTRWNSLKDFYRYLLVGTTYETEKQPSVDLSNMRSDIINDMQEGLLKTFVVKKFFPNEFESYGEFLKHIWLSASPKNAESYYKNIIGTLVSANEHEKH